VNRRIAYTGAIPQVDDLLSTNKAAMVAFATLAADLLGSTGTMLAGFAVTPTAPASMQVSVAPGRIYSLQNVDNTAYGDIAADTSHTILKAGHLADPTLLTLAAPGTTGQSINYLVEVAFQETDTDNSVLPFYNSANPTQALNGPNGSGASLPLTRKSVAVVQLKAGVAAITGSQTTPAADTGFTAAYVVTVAYGATTIISANIVAATGAPLLSGLLNSHHGGGLGQAPQVSLTSEVQGILPLVNLPASVQAAAGSGTGVTPTTWTAGRQQDAFIARATAALTGGGTIAVSSAHELSWTARFMARSVGTGANEESSYFEVLMPSVGAAITVAGGATARTVTSGGIPLNGFDSLYWLPTIGGGPDAGSLLVAADTASWEPPLNAVLLATYNTDNGLIKVTAGPVSLRAGESFNTALNSSAAVANSRSNLGVNVAGGAAVTLSAAQAAYGILTLTGALTANISLVFPNNGQWTVNNQTTGSYTVTCTTAAGSGYIVRQGFTYNIYADGTNMQPDGMQFFDGTAAAPTLQNLESYYTYS
jgi:hypothetical protein